MLRWERQFKEPAVAPTATSQRNQTVREQANTRMKPVIILVLDQQTKLDKSLNAIAASPARSSPSRNELVLLNFYCRSFAGRCFLDFKILRESLNLEFEAAYRSPKTCKFGQNQSESTRQRTIKSFRGISLCTLVFSPIPSTLSRFSKKLRWYFETFENLCSASLSCCSFPILSTVL